jgi:tetratricopeptide (TPR) repeat protein
MLSGPSKGGNAAEIDRLALALAKEPGSKVFIPLAEEYGKAGMWQEAAAVLEDGLKTYPNFITAMVALGRVYDQLNQPIKAKALLEEAVKLSPENLRAHRTLAKIYVAEGATASALRSCQVILSVNAHDEEALSLRASLGTPPPGAAAPVTTKAVGQPSSLPGNRSAADASPLPAATQDPMAGESADIEPQSATKVVSTLTDSGSTPAAKRAAAILHLKRWLDSIRARRRDREPPCPPVAQASSPVV